MSTMADHQDSMPLAQLTRRQEHPHASGQGEVRLAALRAPLAVKVIGAQLVALAVVALFFLSAPAGGWTNERVMIVCGLVTLVHGALILVALRPVHDLESAAMRVWQGDYATRVDASAVADRDVLRIGAMFNLLLDGMAEDRARMRLLTTEIIKAGDRERAVLARELHDSTAQRLAALLLQLGSAARDCDEPELQSRLAVLRDEMHDVLEDVRVLSHTVHPRVLDDLGIVAAIQHLVRETERISDISIEVDADATAAISLTLSSVLYRVAQEALRNVVRHADAKTARIDLSAGNGVASISIADDGRGFDVEEVEGRRNGMGLFTMRERVELVDGTFSITSNPASGTTVSATIPLAERAG